LIGITATLLVSLVAVRSLVAVQTVPTRTESTPAPVVEKPPPQISNAPSDVALAHEIDRAIDESELPLARWGVFVVSLNDGRVLYSRNSDKLFTPASNMKVYTTAVALDLLGADYRWRTSVYTEHPPDDNGVINGDLVLYGRGAPDLTTFHSSSAPSLPALADQLFDRGVRRVRGNVVGDESYFRGESYGDGWQWNDLQWYFGAAPSALTIDANGVDLTITAANKAGTPADLELKRQTDFVHVTNDTTTVEGGATTTVGINRGLSDNELRVWGEFPAGGRSFTAYLSVHNPALWAATSFKEALIARGIKVDGEPRSRDFRALGSEQFDPGKAIELAGADSEPLGEIVHQTNKQSINLNAELILRTLGKERGDTAPDPDPHKMKQRGDDEAGAAVIKLWLERRGISTNGIAIHDGSGLSRLDLVTPEITARLLTAIAGATSAAVFHDSLPIAGRDGTLKPRLRRESGRIVAKTGTLSYDHSLSGYATAQNNEILAFSIFCNDATGHSDPNHIIDQIASLLADFK
jgi:D-alanyl-D-alanine carboxypeptidase/D-alanyl-D-alanine-endopeptidase (penicillin-binding protein 4)